MKKRNRYQKVNFIVFVFLFLFLFSGVFPVLKAPDPDKKITQYNVHNWNMETGLPGNSVFTLRQTQDGFLWIGTQNGLARFDGVDFKLYNKREVRQLMSNDISALYEDQDGALWIGTSSGGLTRYKEEQFNTYPITQYKSLSRISTINGDQWGNLWIGSFTEGLTCLNLEELTFTTYTTKQGLPHNQVSFINRDENGDLWVVTAAAIIKLLKSGIFQVYASQGIFPYLKTVCLYKEDSKELWIGTRGNGLFRSKNTALNDFEMEASVPYPVITYLYEDRIKNLWIGTDRGGLIRTGKGEPGTLTRVERLDCGSVTTIYENREGSLWVGTLGNGLYQLRDSKFTTFTTREGLAHDYINCIYEDRSRHLWIGTKGGLNRLNLKNGELTTGLTTGVGLLGSPVFYLFEDRAGGLLIGTHEGLHWYKEGKAAVLTKKNGLSDNKITCISEDQKGNIWIGTENGLNRFDDNGTIAIFSKKQGLVSNSIQIIYEDRQGSLWVGTDAGLHILKDGIITVFNPGFKMESNIIRCAYEDNEGTLWFGTDGGLIRIKQHKSTLYIVEEGLVENYVYSVLEDEKGYLWLGGRNGISRVKKKELEDVTRGKIHEIQPIRYTEKNGMKSRWCTGAACKTRDGRFWFPTSVGVAMIDPNHIKTNDLAPPVIIEKLIIDSENFTIKSFSGGPGGRFYKKAPLAAGGKMEIPPGRKRLEFHYTAVSFINPGKIQFKIKLQGYDSDWVDRGNLRSTSYTGLSPGNYTFKVIACNHDGVWNKQGASFSFYMKPHWYKTWLAYSLYALIILLGVFFGVKRHYRKMEKEKQRLEQMVEERNMEICEKNVQCYEQSEKLKEMDKAKSRFFANISHEFRTPLTLIMGPLEQILADHPDNKIKTTARMMLRNTRRLLHLVNQLLDLARLDSGKMKLETLRQNIVPFVQYIVMCFESLAMQNKIELNFHREEDELMVYFDPQKLEQVIFNLLFNAFKFTPAEGSITVRLRKVVGMVGFPSGCIEISVHDTGTGISPDQLPYIFDRFYSPGENQPVTQKGSGIGLALTRELVKLHHGEIDVHSREGKNSGTQFIIRLPLGKEYLKPGEIVKPSRVETEPGRSPGSPPLYMIDQKEYAAETQRDENEKRGEERDQAVTAPDVKEKDVILVVEDNRDVRQYIRGALESRYLVKAAKNGEQGIKKAKEIIPDLIISDIMMPDLDGYELCRVLKNDLATSHIPIILLTAKASKASVVKGLKTGADDYIIKPFNTTILCARIKNLIDLRRQLQQTLKREMEFRPAQMSVSQLDKEFLQELQAVIEKNLSNPEFNVEELRKKLYMSGATLYRKVRALTGESPTDFIRSYRLNQAAQLLKQGFGSVTEVAFEVGFNSRTYFSKCFKEKFHQLPSDYQAS